MTVARELPTPPALINWHTVASGRQHAFVGIFRSLCERQRWTARVAIDPTAPFCPECVTLATAVLTRALEYVERASLLEQAS